MPPVEQEYQWNWVTLSFRSIYLYEILKAQVTRWREYNPSKLKTTGPVGSAPITKRPKFGRVIRLIGQM